MVDFQKMVEESPVVLGEGAFMERLSKELHVHLDPHIGHAALIYDDKGHAALEGLYRQYISIGRRFNLPFFVLTATFRASSDRAQRAGFGGKALTIDNVEFLIRLRKNFGTYTPRVAIGVTVGPKGNAYDPREALSENDSYEYHAAQLVEAERSGADFLFAATFPAVSEAAGCARFMARTKLPYIISFIIRRNGALLDGTTIHDAIAYIDGGSTRPPLCYMVNCVHPRVLKSALAVPTNASDAVANRLKGIQGNTSERTPEELDGIEGVESEDPAVFADEMISLYRTHGIKILAGCCGTDERHIEQMAQRLQNL